MVKNSANFYLPLTIKGLIGYGKKEVQFVANRCKPKFPTNIYYVKWPFGKLTAARGVGRSGAWDWCMHCEVRLAWGGDSGGEGNVPMGERYCKTNDHSYIKSCVKTYKGCKDRLSLWPSVFTWITSWFNTILFMISSQSIRCYTIIIFFRMLIWSLTKQIMYPIKIG